jgi:hypothetical protein
MKPIGPEHAGPRRCPLCFASEPRAGHERGHRTSAGGGIRVDPSAGQWPARSEIGSAATASDSDSVEASVAGPFF